MRDAHRRVPCSREARDQALREAPALLGSAPLSRQRRRSSGGRTKVFLVPVPGHRAGNVHRRIRAAGHGVVGPRSDATKDAAGSVVASERTRTLALAASTVVPFAAGLVFFGWSVWAYHDSPPLKSAIPFGEVGDAWVYAVLFALGVLLRRRPDPGAGDRPLAALPRCGRVCAALLVMATIVMQGIVEPLRYVRVFMPWTYFAARMVSTAIPSAG